MVGLRLGLLLGYVGARRGLAHRARGGLLREPARPRRVEVGRDAGRGAHVGGKVLRGLVVLVLLLGRVAGVDLVVPCRKR